MKEFNEKKKKWKITFQMKDVKMKKKVKTKEIWKSKN